jgi:hypothetical protein
MSKMNYGTRFNNAGVSARGGFDDRLAEDFAKDHGRMQAIIRNMPQHKREQMYHTKAQKAKARNAKNAPGHEREEAEQRMAEAVRKAVALLEFHMDAMVQHRRVAGRPTYINQQILHNTLLLLRTKCGVKFDHVNPEYSARVPLAPSSLLKQQVDDEIELKRHEQQAARERRMREITDRLLARPKHMADHDE